MSAESALWNEDRSHRPCVMARHHVVASGHPWASTAGFQILEAGGNATDAGVAVGLCINVLECHYTSLGGIAPLIVYQADRDEVSTLGGLGHWPKAASLEHFRDKYRGTIPEGLLRTVIPAGAGTWITALEKFGTMSFADVAAPALRFAREGFPMYPFMRKTIDAYKSRILGWPATKAVFMPNGRAPENGETFVQADLAKSLQYMIDQEAAQKKKGRAAGLKAAFDAFYQGDIAKAFVASQKENGGWMTMEDMASFHPEIEAPSRTRFQDIDVYGCTPLGQGPMVLEALNILEGIDLKVLGHNSPAYIHAVVEALKLAAADREAYYGDPKFVDVPLKELLSKDYAAKRRALFRPDRAEPGMPRAGAVAGRTPRPWHPDPSAGGAIDPRDDQRSKAGTSFLCVVDKKGNIFAATPSDGILATPIVAGTGLTPSTWGSRGYTDPDHPAKVAPNHRPRMASNPAIAIRKGQMTMAFGSPGAEVLGQAMTQIFLNNVVFGMDPQTAVEQPRFASFSWPSSIGPHEYKPAMLRLEKPFGEATAKALTALGHKIEWWPAREETAGSTCMIQADLKTGVKLAGADSRRTAYAVGW